MELLLGEIRLFSYNKVPDGWHLCDGTLLPIGQNTALFSLIGNFYGGDGIKTFGLPDLRGRAIVGAVYQAEESSSFPYLVSASGGTETVVLTMQQMPQHRHEVRISDAPGTTAKLQGGVYAAVRSPLAQNLYGKMPETPVAIEPKTIGAAGSGRAHDNMQPFLALEYCIALTGSYPRHPD